VVFVRCHQQIAQPERVVVVWLDQHGVTGTYFAVAATKMFYVSRHFALSPSNELVQYPDYRMMCYRDRYRYVAEY
jgi:hypothetical protein